MSSQGLRRKLEARLLCWPEALSASLVPQKPGLARRVDSRPARQVLYTCEGNAPRTPFTDRSVPRFQITRYRGRVDDYEAASRTVNVTLWEEPSGKEWGALLDLMDFKKAQLRPMRDLAFFLWSWFELEGEELIPHHQVEAPILPPRSSLRR